MVRIERDSQIDLHEDFINAYNKVLKSLGKMACLVEKSELIFMAINSKAPRYYISYDRARKIISEYYKNGSFPSCHNNNKRMVNELIEKYKEERKKFPDKRNSLIIEDIIYSEASSFFIARTKAYEILHKYYAKKH